MPFKPTHGKRRTKIYYIWCNIVQRCCNPKNVQFPDYGGRGILLCTEWRDFVQFYKDVGDPPIGKTLDRINNEDGYHKNNFRWATQKEQANNKRSNVFLTHNGKKQTMKQWADEIGMDNRLLHKRLKRGMTLEECIKLGQYYLPDEP